MISLYQTILIKDQLNLRYKNYQLKANTKYGRNINLTQFPQNRISLNDFKKVYDNFFKLHIYESHFTKEKDAKDILVDFIAATATLEDYK